MSHNLTSLTHWVFFFFFFVTVTEHALKEKHIFDLLESLATHSEKFFFHAYYIYIYPKMS